MKRSTLILPFLTAFLTIGLSLGTSERGLEISPGLASGDELPEGNRSAGRKVFKKQCLKCHSVKPEKHGTFGPNLYGIVGKKAGIGAEHDYSDVLKTAGFVWTVERIDKWLADPASDIPGNAMKFKGLNDAQARADVIAYLMAAGKR
jgi:cytochrome c